MSALIEECAQRLADKFGDIAKTEGKINAKAYINKFIMH